ncbi:uncharacterized protein [Coffea arabica]|uniref:Uncharacterized protein isoform X2 n=1 Tax=Coffea arabica TaxID=13443 RepID=A0ABM4WAS5_COFAR
MEFRVFRSCPYALLLFCPLDILLLCCLLLAGFTCLLQVPFILSWPCETLPRVTFPDSYPYRSFVLLELADLHVTSAALIPSFFPAFFLPAGLLSLGRFHQSSSDLCFELGSGKLLHSLFPQRRSVSVDVVGLETLVQVLESHRARVVQMDGASKAFRRFEFGDSQGITVSAVVYDDDISHVDGLLLPFKKYYISTVEICEIPESTPPGIYRFYWVINNKTTVEEVTDEGGPMLPFYFHLRSFESFHFVADTDEFIRIALSTRNDSVILVNPPVREANQLKHWAARNEKSFAGLLEDNMHAKQSPQLFHQSQQKIISIIDVVPTQKVSWVKAQVFFQHIIQKYYYMGCVKCHYMTAANFGTTFTCNHCSEKQEDSPRCRFDVDLTDHTDTLTASVFGDLAKTLLTLTALEAMNYHEKNAELLLEKVHQELQSKMFILKLKPTATRDRGGHQRYTIVYCFKDASSEESANKSADPDVQTISQEIGTTVPTNAAPENQVSSSKVRIRLDTKFDQSEDANDNTSKDEEPPSSKKAKKN